MAEDGMKQPPRVTIRTVAADAGVSVAAVSKVLRNAYGVSDALRLKVDLSIERLGYRPNMAARSLRGRTNTIGLLLLDMSNPFLTQIVDGVNDALDPAGYKLMIGVSRANAHIERSLIESMIDFRLDGLILVAPRLPDETLEAVARQIPIVVIGQHVQDARTFDTVNADDLGGARQVVQTFADRGYRDIAMISWANTDISKPTVGDVRRRGFIAAMQEIGFGDKIRLLDVPEERHLSIPAMEQILTAPDRPRAIFCWSDLSALVLINVAHSLGIRVPEDVAIVGFDNTPAAAMPLVDLASVDQNGGALGAEAARDLFSRIEGRAEARHSVLPTRLILRGSL